MDVAVLGAGTGGRGIAQRCAVGGHDVQIYAADANAVMDAVDAIEAGLDDRVAGGAAKESDREAALDRVDGTTGLDAAVSGAEVVVDATDRERGDRQSLLAAVEESVDDDALIAPSGATVAVTAAAAGLRNPGRALGLHFVDPPSGSLVEVVTTPQTTAGARDRARSFVEGLGCEAVVVSDAPGFTATRLSLALAAEAMRMLEAGVADARAIDRAMEAGRDHPIGPLAATDMAGLDARLAELRYLARNLGERFEPPDVLESKVDAGHLGRKTGEGFYVWEDGEPTGPSESNPTPDSADSIDNHRH